MPFIRIFKSNILIISKYCLPMDLNVLRFCRAQTWAQKSMASIIFQRLVISLMSIKKYATVNLLMYLLCKNIFSL